MPKYIDADKLVDDLRKYHRSRKNYGKIYETISREIYSTISKQPAADVEPKRKTGRWIERSNGLNPYCSECHAIGDRSPFCRHCGAKMDAEPPKED